MYEAGEAAEDDDYDADDEPVIAQVRLQGCRVSQRGFAVDALDLEAFVPPDARPQDTSPGNHAAQCSHRGEIAEGSASRPFGRGHKG